MAVNEPTGRGPIVPVPADHGWAGLCSADVVRNDTPELQARVRKLVSDVLEGDEQAIRKFFELFRGLLVARAWPFRPRLMEWTTAADLTSDLLQYLVTGLRPSLRYSPVGGRRPTPPLRSWVLNDDPRLWEFVGVTVRNLCLDLLGLVKTHQAYGATASVPPRLDRDTTSLVTVPWTARIPRPDEEYQRAETHRLLMAALEALPRKERQVMQLLVEGRPPQEVAAILGVTQSTVSMIKTRASRMLQLAIANLNADRGRGNA